MRASAPRASRCAEEPDHHHRPFAEVRRLVDRGRRCPTGCATRRRRVRPPGRGRGPNPRRRRRRRRVPRGRLARRHRGRRRHVRRPRGPRRRRGAGRRASPSVSGTVRGSHGLLPNPAPAVVALLARRTPVPTASTSRSSSPRRPARRCCPTLAAGFGPMPAMTVGAVGYGAGRRDLDGRPNVVQVVIGDQPGRARRRRCATRPAGRAARRQRRRRHGRDRWPMPSARCSTPVLTTPGSRRS